MLPAEAILSARNRPFIPALLWMTERTMFPLDVCEACGMHMTKEEESVCWTCALSTFTTSLANHSATSRAAGSQEQMLRQKLPRFFVPGDYPTTLRDIRVAKQRWRLEVLLTGKTHGFMPRISALVFRPPYRWAGTIPYPSRVDGYAPAIRHWTVVTYVIDFVYPKLNDRSRDAEG